MGQKRQPWDRPVGSGIPNRPGDKDETPLYTALGQAVSAWEGVNAASVSLMQACVGNAESDTAEALSNFGDETRVHKRADLIRQEFRAYLGRRGGHGSKLVSNVRQSLDRALAAYVEWSARRNDLAHGYVTPADGPDYSHADQPIVRTFALLPSHARTGRWLHGEPEFNYLASEIEGFARAFAALDERFETLARRVAALGTN